jgi:hypothetical protein
MTGTCEWATARWLRFDQIETPDSLDLSRAPGGVAGRKIGPDGAPATSANAL